MPDLAEVFRREAGRCTATLIRVLGDIDLAEDAVAEALAIAAEQWPAQGVPPNPGGWITTTARNRAIDRLRRESTRTDRHLAALRLETDDMEPHHNPELDDLDGFVDVVADDQLRLMFLCCHPALAADAQVALTLRLLGGLDTPEIARAFLVPEPTLAQRIVRAKRKLRDNHAPYRVPRAAELPDRLHTVLAASYLIYTEGHTATTGDSLTRVDLSREAIRGRGDRRLVWLAHAGAGLAAGGERRSSLVRAVVVEAFGAMPRVLDVPSPRPAPHGVVVRVDATGLCRSDWHAWQGHDPDVVLPHVPGHELAGTIVEVGHEVRLWHPGQRVTVPFVCACGTCSVCRAGEGQVCPYQTQPGFTGWGSFAELVALDHADVNVVALPDDLDAVTAAGLGCRVATAHRAVDARARLQPGEWLSVHGCGGVGLSAVMVGVAIGARVVAVDVSPDALRAASALGAEVLLDASTIADIPAAVVEATGGGAHVAVDALGSPTTCADSVLALRRRGRQVQVGLLPAATGHPAVPMERVVGYELDLLGSHGMAATGYPRLLDLVASGRLHPDALIQRRISLEDIPAALAALGEGSLGAGITVATP